ncbi:MAG: Holliday junction branch migration protein RuvA [Bacteroidaceae bacterium]|jgi:Holliday junction DNA helicase RuvA
MIDYVRGEISELLPAYAVLETHGVGYKMQISLYTYSAIQGKKEARLYVFESIREDAYLLYGFADRQERELFEMLLSVSGVGAATALTILSSFSPDELSRVIRNEEVNLLKTAKGIGQKTAQRIIVDLKDKMGRVALSGGNAPMGGAGARGEVYEEAVQALTMLGFSAAPAQKVVHSLLQELPEAPVERIIKEALKRL